MVWEGRDKQTHLKGRKQEPGWYGRGRGVIRAGISGRLWVSKTSYFRVSVSKHAEQVQG